MPIAGYKTFDECVKAYARRPGVYSPGGLCRLIEKRSLAYGPRAELRQSNPVAELIQTGWLGTSDVVELVDAADKTKATGEMLAPGVQMILAGHDRDQGRFTIAYAVFRRQSSRWVCLQSGPMVQARFDLAKAKKILRTPEDLSPSQKSLVKTADALLRWIALQRRQA